MGRSELIDMLRRDAVFAVRVLRSNPTVTAAIVLTLALGIGATTAIFSVVDAVLLRPLPYAHSDRIVRIFETLNGRMAPLTPTDLIRNYVFIAARDQDTDQ